jgi:hypothetical protein
MKPYVDLGSSKHRLPDHSHPPLERGSDSVPQTWDFSAIFETPHGMRDSDSLQLLQGGFQMGKTGRKRRAHKKKGANHVKRPNA